MMADLSMKTPFAALVAGPTGSGKTFLVSNLLINKHLLMKPIPQRVIYYYKQWQGRFNVLSDKRVVHEFVEGLPTVEEFKEKVSPYKEFGSIVVFDDAMMELLEKDITEIFSVHCHHLNASVIFISQNLFLNKSVYRNISLNCKYLFLMKNPRDSSQIINFAKQFSPGCIKYLLDSYKHAVEKPYSYLFVDMSQDINDCFRVRGKILPHEGPQVVYFKK